MTTDREDHELDEELSAAARTLHAEWDSPALWPAIARQIQADEGTASASRRQLARWLPASWQAVAAAVLAITIGSAVWLGSRLMQPPASQPGNQDSQARLLSEDALAEIERSEAQYVRAIEELTRVAAPKLDRPDSQLLANLRERLVTLDSAIEEARMEIDGNPFNADLRRQLLWIYQEKRSTLEQVEEYEDDAL